MKTFRPFLMALMSLAMGTVLRAEVPQMISYQGRLTVGNQNFNGPGEFKFALVNGDGSVTHWSNDGTSVAGSEPVAAVSLNVERGLYSVLLGDTTLAHMTAIPFAVFNNSDVRLRVWFNDGAHGFELMSPDLRIVAMGYAMMAANVSDGAITASKLADDAVTASKLAPGVVGNEQLGDDIQLGSATANGKLTLWNSARDQQCIQLLGANYAIRLLGSDGQVSAAWSGEPSGDLLLYDRNSRDLTVKLSAGTFTDPLSGAFTDQGGSLTLSYANFFSGTRAVLSGLRSGGTLTLGDESGTSTVFLDGDLGKIHAADNVSVVDSIGGDVYCSLGKNGSSGGLFRSYDELHMETVKLGSAVSGGFLQVNNASQARRVLIEGVSSTTAAGGEISIFDNSGTRTVQINGANNAASGSVFQMGQGDGTTTVLIDAEVGTGTGGGSYFQLRKGDGTPTIHLRADDGGSGKITTQVLEITGGSDLSENFDINATNQPLQPGLIVSIDPDNPGQLVVSSSAYDHTVAGVVSGAGGVKPGMLMGQPGTAADGKHPVALTGRVYCWVDADLGAVRPGDLLTTSDTPGHAMKVTDHARAQGAVIGKAMTGLEKGRGLLLVLVSLQ